MRVTGVALLLTLARAKVHVDEVVATAEGVRLRILTRGDSADLPVLVYTPFAWTFPAIVSGDHHFMPLADTFLMTTYDPRGVGGSANSTAATSVEHFIDDLIDVSRYAIRRFGKQKVYLLGISTGASFAVHAAHRQPALFEHVISNGPTVDLIEQNRENYLALHEIWRMPQWLLPLLPRVIAGVFLMLRVPFHSCRSQFFCAMEFFTPLTFGGSEYYTSGLRVFLQAARTFEAALALDDVHTIGIGSLGAMPVPHTFLIGKHDKYMANATRVREYVHARRTACTYLHIIEDASHGWHVEQPHVFRQLVRGVLSKECAPEQCA